LGAVFALLLLIGTSTFLIGGGAAQAATSLAGSPYDGTDGAADAGVTFHNDAPSSHDNSYVGGATEANVCPTVNNNHSTPPKDDILSYAVSASHGTNGDGFLYLAWTRATKVGTTTIEFELNQSTAGCGNGVNPVRTENDLRFIYNFHGGTVDSIQESSWVSGAWTAETTIASSQEEASIANPSQLFGEAVIDLTTAGVFDSDSCTTLASAFARSRSSSGSTGNELKDLVLPIGESISNCGSVSLHKVDDNGTDLPDAVFGLYTDSLHTTLATDVTGDNPCTTDSDGNCSWTNVMPGTYYVHEVSAPEGYAADDTTATVPVAAGVASSVSADFVDPRDVGNIRIFKTLEDQDGKAVLPDKPADLNGAAFTVLNASDSSQAKIWSDGSDAGCAIDNGAGYCDVIGLPTGDYIVHETAAPPGTGLTATDAPVTVSANQVCGESVQLQGCYAEVTMTNLNAGTPDILVEKSGVTQAHEGDTVTYSFKVTNTGNVTLTDIGVDDDILGEIGTINTLLPGEFATLTKDYKVPVGTADIKNTVTACGIDALETEACDTDVHTLDPLHPAIGIDKTVSDAKPHVGDTVTFSFAVTNTGDVALHDVAVNDDVLGAIGTIPALAVGQTVTLTHDETITGATPLDNVGTAAGKDPLDKVVTANDKQSIEVVAGLVIVKPAVAPALAATGAPIRLEVEVAASLMVLGIVLTVTSRRRLKAQRIV
jgi:hypothetical protein